MTLLGDATEVSGGAASPSQENVGEIHVSSSMAEYVSPVTTRRISSARKCKTRPSRRRRGPPRGLFDVDQDRSWAILDTTGKKILQVPAASTNRHAWLDEMSQSTCATSVTASPVPSSLAMHQRSVSAPVTGSNNHGLTINTALPDVMAADPNSEAPFSHGEHSQEMGPPDALLSSGLRSVGGDYAVSPEPESDVFDEITPVSKKSRFSLADFLEDFDDDEYDEYDDEEDDDDVSGLPLFMPADDNLIADGDGLTGPFDSLDAAAFRRNAGIWSTSRPGTAQSLSLQTTPITHPSLDPAQTHVSQPRTSHKRKASSTPYHDETIYGDVTPVERKVLSIPKRRRTRS